MDVTRTLAAGPAVLGVKYDGLADRCWASNDIGIRCAGRPVEPTGLCVSCLVRLRLAPAIA